jgi:hypothetical protein
VIEGHCRQHQLATAYCSHLKARIQLIGKSAIICYCHRVVLVGLPQHFIHRESTYAFVDAVRDKEVKFPLFMGCKRTLDKALN